MLDHKHSQPVQFVRTKSVRLRNADGFEPELGNVVAMFNMNVRRLRSLEAVKEEAKA